MIYISRKIPCSSFVLHHKHPTPMTSLHRGSPSFRPGHSSGGAAKTLGEEKFYKQRVVTLCTRLVPQEAAQEHQGLECLSIWKWGTFVHGCELQSCRKACDISSCSICMWSRGHQKVESHSQICSYASGLIIQVLRVCSLLEDLFQQLKWIRSPPDLLVVWEAK